MNYLEELNKITVPDKFNESPSIHPNVLVTLVNECVSDLNNGLTTIHPNWIEFLVRKYIENDRNE